MGYLRIPRAKVKRSSAAKLTTNGDTAFTHHATTVHLSYPAPHAFVRHSKVSVTHVECA